MCSRTSPLTSPCEDRGPPPFPGAVFDKTSHRRKNPHTGEEHLNDQDHPHEEHAAATACHAQPGLT